MKLINSSPVTKTTDFLSFIKMAYFCNKHIKWFYETINICLGLSLFFFPFSETLKPLFPFHLNYWMTLNFVIFPSNIPTIKTWFFYSFIGFYWSQDNSILFGRVLKISLFLILIERMTKAKCFACISRKWFVLSWNMF